MSEFDLIPARLEAGLPLSLEWLVRGGIPFLCLSLGQPGGGPEIPGLVSGGEAVEGPFEVVQSEGGWRFDWKGKTLLHSLGGPCQLEVGWEQLPGLKHRPGEELPPSHRQAIRWDWRLSEKTRLYGLGQRSLPLERRGTAPVNWTTDEPSGHGRTTDPLYQAHPLLWGCTPEGLWWAVFLVHSGYSRFDLGQDHPQRMSWLTLGSSLEIQIHAGSSPGELHASLRQLLPAPTPPPLWALGFHQSRWGYRDSGEITRLVEGFRQAQLPLDVVHLDIDHMQDYRSFTFSEERFPDPAGLLRGLAGEGVRVVTIIDPGLRFDPGRGYAPLESGLAGDHFLKSPSGAPVVAYCWPDEALFPDFSREGTRQWWAEQCAFYLELGVAGLWIDMNEPATFDRPFWKGGAQQLPLPLETPTGPPDQKGQIFADEHNLYGSHMACATHQSWQGRPTRPWVLTRSGFTGVAGQAWSWMGDNTSWWEHLAMSLPQLASMGLVGSAMVGVDVGGFFGHATGELYAAWMEASVIYPLMRAHSALGTREAHPWSFGPEVQEVARTALQLRYRLLPYLYGCAMAQSEGDVPWLRPLFFDFPEDERFFALEDQVMVGPHLMAAPLLVRGQRQRLVQFPEGGWYCLHSARFYEGGSCAIVERRPGLTPLFLRAGSIVPVLTPEARPQHTAELQGLPWQLLVAPGRDGVKSCLYWDEGEGWDFQEGRMARLELTLEGSRVRLLGRSGKGMEALPRLTLCRPEQGWVEDGWLDW